MRLLRQPGQAWGAWDVWASQQHPDGAFPSQQELDQLDGIVITGDRCAGALVAGGGGGDADVVGTCRPGCEGMPQVHGGARALSSRPLGCSWLLSAPPPQRLALACGRPTPAGHCAGLC